MGAGIEEATTTSKHSCSVIDNEWSTLMKEVPFMAVESALMALEKEHMIGS